MNEFQSSPGNGSQSLVKYYVLSGRGLCVGLITRPEESDRMCGMSGCDREASTMRSPWPTRGCRAVAMDQWLNDRC